MVSNVLRRHLEQFRLIHFLFFYSGLLRLGIGFYCRFLLDTFGFVSMATQSDFLRDALSGYNQRDLAAIIDRLAGDKDNLRIDLNHVRLSAGNQKFELNGMVSFKIFHKPPNAHNAIKDTVKKDV